MASLSEIDPLFRKILFELSVLDIQKKAISLSKRTSSKVGNIIFWQAILIGDFYDGEITTDNIKKIKHLLLVMNINTVSDVKKRYDMVYWESFATSSPPSAFQPKFAGDLIIESDLGRLLAAPFVLRRWSDMKGLTYDESVLNDFKEKTTLESLHVDSDVGIVISFLDSRESMIWKKYLGDDRDAVMTVINNTPLPITFYATPFVYTTVHCVIQFNEKDIPDSVKNGYRLVSGVKIYNNFKLTGNLVNRNGKKIGTLEGILHIDESVNEPLISLLPLTIKLDRMAQNPLLSQYGVDADRRMRAYDILSSLNKKN
jgi:hypothetical protein